MEVASPRAKKSCLVLLLVAPIQLHLLQLKGYVSDDARAAANALPGHSCQHGAQGPLWIWSAPTAMPTSASAIVATLAWVSQPAAPARPALLRNAAKPLGREMRWQRAMANHDGA